MTYNDFLFRGEIEELDPDVAELIRHETARQARYLIMIPSESTVPYAVRSALSSSFHNIYAEGYPLEETRTMTQSEILDYNLRLPEYRRQADLRYYKGTEYADIVEALARRRAAELYATNGYSADDLFVNVQPLSGAPANNAVYTALLNVGDTVMGMDLIMGGHLTHGSPVNRSGKFFKIVSYSIHPETEKLDYDAMMQLALEHKPKMIIGGYSSYPWTPDWREYRRIADAVGAYLLADIAHFAGLVAAGVYPSPVGIADIVTFTTHKTLNGPRGAVIITHRKDLAPKLDRGVFPGEQGGPHVNSIAALAVALRIAHTDQFKQLQHQIVANAQRLAAKLAQRGFRIPHGGTNTHMFVVDCKSIVGPDGTTLSGDMAARILDLVGIVCNRQTIPGDTSALRPSGIRLGTPWITQRGFGAEEIDQLGDIIADVLSACIPFSLTGKPRALERAKIDFDILQTARLRVRELAASVGIDTDVRADGYPHFHYLDDQLGDGWYTFVIRGERAAEFLNIALTSDVARLQIGDQQPTHILEADGRLMASGIIERIGEHQYRLTIDRQANRVAAWLRALSDGFIVFDPTDIYAKVPGPVDIQAIGPVTNAPSAPSTTDGYAQKAYFIGCHGAHYNGPSSKPLDAFYWKETNQTLRTTPLHALHTALGAKMAPFAGYDMPLWYDSVIEEHLAVRTGAGIFDVTHMGVFDAKGDGACEFLDLVTTNDVARLAVGESHYTYFLDTNGLPLDDLMIYRIDTDHYLIVVNASNNDKNWAWLNDVKEGHVQIDPNHTSKRFGGTDRFVLRDLRQPTVGDDQRVDIALQGPKSRDILLSLQGSDDDKAKLKSLPWAGITHVILGGYDLIVSRTGYTGERVAYELFVHPNEASSLFKDLVESGAKPCGLAARDSLRIEAGLPLYGHELEGPLGLNPSDAGFSNYVKLYKPFFIGKAAFIAHEKNRTAEVTRFRMDAKGARPAHQGDPVVDNRGRVVGIVTSCSIDSEGYQLGQVYLKRDYLEPGTKLGVFAGSAKIKAKEVGSLKIGDKAILPEPITIISRFPKKK